MAKVIILRTENEASNIFCPYRSRDVGKPFCCGTRCMAWVLDDTTEKELIKDRKGYCSRCN